MQKFVVSWTNTQGEHYHKIFQEGDSTANLKYSMELFNKLAKSNSIKVVYNCELLAINTKK